MKIHQGDQYIIPIKIKFDGEVVTPDNCTDVRVKISTKLFEYNGGEGDLTFNSTDGIWCVPLSELQSFKYNNAVNIQTAVKIGEQFIYSDTKRIEIGTSIIKEPWSDGSV